MRLATFTIAAALITSGIVLANARSPLSMLACYPFYLTLKVLWLFRVSNRSLEVVIKASYVGIFLFAFAFLSHVFAETLSFNLEKWSEVFLACALALGLSIYPLAYTTVDCVEASRRQVSLPIAFFEIGVFLNLMLEFFHYKYLTSSGLNVLFYYALISLVLTLSLAYLQFSLARRLGYLTLSIASALTLCILTMRM